MMTSSELERRSSATTLSDMEIFIFPELMYSLLLANIMSPRIWRWLEDPWFEGLDTMTPYKRITRMRQYIMDHYDFNLDLDTWGLTCAETELARFSNFIDREALSQSNALFGYQGDKYYFDIDIRTHFGLDKYEGSIIPYWKTETVESMDAFMYRPDYKAGAGECVSLAALYAAALFIVARIPLDDIYLMATPLHSQNYVLVNDGIITNNRRLVTKNMWFNGTALSAQARRALENEQVTVVAHASGFVHAIYDEATISPSAYARFSASISDYLKTPLTRELLGNFMRQARDMQKCFQLRWKRNGADCYLPAEKAFAYENGSPYRITDGTRAKLLQEVDDEDYTCCHPLQHRIILNDFEDFIDNNPTDIDNLVDIAKIEKQFGSDCLNASLAIKALIRFCHVQPRLPDPTTKHFTTATEPLALTQEMGRDKIIARLEQIRSANPSADLAFYAYRDLSRTAHEPFLKACIERNPVCIDGTKDLDDDALAVRLNTMPDSSIYDGDGRLSQPDEVWNFGRGDGLEKALLLANVLHHRTTQPFSISITATEAVLSIGSVMHTFPTTKALPSTVWNYPLEILKGTVSNGSAQPRSPDENGSEFSNGGRTSGEP